MGGVCSGFSDELVSRLTERTIRTESDRLEADAQVLVVDSIDNDNDNLLKFFEQFPSVFLCQQFRSRCREALRALLVCPELGA